MNCHRSIDVNKELLNINEKLLLVHDDVLSYLYNYRFGCNCDNITSLDELRSFNYQKKVPQFNVTNDFYQKIYNAFVKSETYMKDKYLLTKEIKTFFLSPREKYIINYFRKFREKNKSFFYFPSFGIRLDKKIKTLKCNFFCVHIYNEIVYPFMIMFDNIIEQYYFCKENIHMLRINDYYNLRQLIKDFFKLIQKSNNKYVIYGAIKTNENPIKNLDNKFVYYNKFHLSQYNRINSNKRVIEI